MATDFHCRHLPTTHPSTLQTAPTGSQPTGEGLGDAVFESCDGTRIPFSLALLAQLSSFFSNLTTLPVPSEDEHGRPIYSLPSATSAGLAYALQLVLALSNGGSPLPFEVAPHEDVLVIADAYDLPLVGTWLTIKSVLLLDKDPFIPYAIASITGDRAIADISIKKAIGRDISRMPGWATSLLKRHAPLALIRLYELQAEHAAAMEAFGRKVRSVDGAGNAADWNDICKGGEGCECYRMTGGDWSALRARCAEMLLQSFARHGARGMDAGSIKDVTLALAWCGRCQVALEKSCMSAWRDSLGDLASSATA